ncbi:MAG: helix-turn-helix transcriptional regulator [Candidatus Omnitrophica bacterium]|nr:helix-turn-helix transcriptional regulator [Candidatus Omnitrophota bacterium]
MILENHSFLILSIITINGHMSSVNLPKRIKELRGKNNLSQDQLSKKANLPFSTLAKIESGYTPNPSMETLIKIADAFGVGIDELLGRK